MKRLDIMLVEEKYFESRSKAKMAIKSKAVSVNNCIVSKPSYKVADTDNIEIVKETLKYVGRGGLKLEKAIQVFDLNLDGLSCLDIGASTGGFTDCMLQNGAQSVVAIDVGTNQLHSKIMNNAKVTSIEQQDIREYNPTDERVYDFISIDVSFISLLKILPKAKDLLSEHGKIVALIKPQFEVGEKNIGKTGVVKDKKLQKQVIKDIINESLAMDLYGVELTYSLIAAEKGNIEFLILFTKTKGNILEEEEINKIVNDSAHANSRR